MAHSVPSSNLFTCAQAVFSPAVGANGPASVCHCQIYLGMPVPDRDPGLGVGTSNIALVVKILGL